MLFKPEKVDSTASGKTIGSLDKSRNLRDSFLLQFGCIPTSILTYDKKDRSIDVHAADSYVNTSVVKKYSKHYDGHRKEIPNFDKIFNASGANVRLGALSRFPQNIGRLLVQFYCPEKGTVYDPFAGHNSRMQLTFELGRNYAGVDISKEFMEANRSIRRHLIRRARQSLLSNDVIPSIRLFECSSSKVDLPNDSCDFTVTSPPYWNIEHYGDEPEQLGNAKTYEGFLDLLRLHIVENYRILKSESFCCWCINDFKIDGIYRPFHADLIPYFVNAGFVLHTIYIIDLGRPIHASFVQWILKLKAFPKQHEYCLVFRKG